MSTKQTVYLDENQLIQQAVAGDLESFNQIVLLYQDMAYNHAHAVAGDPIVAEDATQESFIKAFQALKSFRGDSFRGWLLRIVTNTVFDMVRRSQKHATQPYFLKMSMVTKWNPLRGWLTRPHPFKAMWMTGNSQSHCRKCWTNCPMPTALEGDSEHLIAQAIRRHAQDRKLTLPAISNFSALKGPGVQADFENQMYYIGGPRLLEMLALTPEGDFKIFTDEANSKARSVVYLTNKEKIIAAISIADVIRPESKQAVEELSSLGIEVAMLTGDSQAVAKAVANQLGIQRVFAEVLPEHKDQKVIELKNKASALPWSAME